MSSDPIWQRGFFDHVLRSDGSYHQKWEYVLANPVRARLVLQVGAWPYAGEVIPIDRA
jgi:putative transposase